MKKKHLLTLAVLLLPIVILAIVAYQKYLILAQGTEVILTIEGFDPRDILSGHYLTYRINYNLKNNCPTQSNNSPVYLCLYQSGDNNWVSTIDNSLEYCQLYINGRCEYDRFTADIEKFFIPEEFATKLDQAVRNKQGKIVLRIDAWGNAVVKDLLIDDKSWREYVK